MLVYVGYLQNVEEGFGEESLQESTIFQQPGVLEESKSHEHAEETIISDKDPLR
tara:strand:+ start:322 stop:483 length:162 start_codon:yes stop_codon:yes gene_type:complete